jgi:hypothetical protein
VELINLTSNYTRTYELARWSPKPEVIKPGAAKKAAKKKSAAKG